MASSTKWMEGWSEEQTKTILKHSIYRRLEVSNKAIVGSFHLISAIPVPIFNIDLRVLLSAILGQYSMLISDKS